MLQKGIREYLLCGSCENKLSKWEGYASQIFNGGTELMAEGHGDLVIVNGIDYKSFKLFQLSILWRAGVSSLTLFEAVKLGSYEETIRQMLLNEDAGSEDAFGCTVFCLLNSDHQVVTDVITPPIKDRVSNQICYRFIFNGFMWVYFVSKNKVKGISDGFLQKCGRFIFMYKNIEDLKSIRNFATEIYRQNKLGKN